MNKTSTLRNKKKRMGINEIEKNIIKIKKNQKLIFWKDKINKILATLTKKKRENTQTVKSEMKEEILQQTAHNKKDSKQYYEWLYAKKLYNLDEMDKCL